MTKLQSVKIHFYFPQMSRGLKDKREFVRLLIKALQKNGSIEYAGYSKDKYLYDHLLLYIGGNKITEYRPLSIKQKKRITKTIHATIKKCRKKLPPPDTLFVFVFPWFPDDGYEAMEGVMGFAPYSCVFHLFISPQTFTKKSLANTVAHEFNHAVFYYCHYERFGNYTLLDHLLIEGLAENFREEVVGGKPAPWSVALTKKGAFQTLELLRPLLYSRNARLRREVLFGSKKYKRWTGYSIGYWLIKDFRKKHRKLSWQEIIQMSTEDILGVTG